LSGVTGRGWFGLDQRVCVWVVEEAVITIGPYDALGPKIKVCLGALVIVIVKVLIRIKLVVLTKERKYVLY